MSFAAIQLAYAEHKVATYPLKADKTPAVKHYTRIRAPYSAKLAMKFSDFMVAGFCAGPRNRITVIDIDSTDPRLVDEIEHTFGPSPLHVLTPSGGRHLYYRHGGEPRRIRPLPGCGYSGRRQCGLRRLRNLQGTLCHRARLAGRPGSAPALGGVASAARAARHGAGRQA